MSSFLGSVGGAIGDFMGSLTGTSAAAEAQYNAQQEALEQQRSQTLLAQQNMERAAQAGQGMIQDYTGQAGGALGSSLQDMMANYNMAGNRLDDASRQALMATNRGFGAAQGQLGGLLGLQGYAAGATSPIGAYDATGGAANAQSLMGNSLQATPYNVTGMPSEARGMLGQSRLAGILGESRGLEGRLGQRTDLQMDPGYQFRREQGEDAINRAASASGSRGGGATMKALAEYNQNLASQEFGAADQRRMAENQQRMGLLGQQMGAASGIDQSQQGLARFLDAQGQSAAFNQAGRTDAAAQQGIQNRMGLAQFLDAHQQRGAFNQAGRQDAAALAAQRNQMGLAGLGFGAQQQMANLSAQQGQSLASLYGQQGANMANLFGQQAGAHQAYGSQLAGLLSGAGTNMANIGIGAAGQGMNTAQQLNQQTQNFAQFGGMQEQARANATTQGLGLLMQGGSALFSDARLKQGIERVDGPFDGIGLPSYRWRWNDSALELGMWGKSNGVIAQDVQDLYPEAVITHPSGYLMVDYGKLREIAEGQQ